MNRIRIALLGIMMILSHVALAQEDSLQTENNTKAVTLKDSVSETKVISKRIKVDGVASVVGDFVILESDIDKSFIDMETQGMPTDGITKCQVLGKLMEDKLYAHQAIQDSIVVSDAEISGEVQGKIEYLVGAIGSMEKLLNYYNMEDEQTFREELTEITKMAMLSQRMRAKILEEMEITPEEVRIWFNGIPEDQRPVFGDEVEVAQIVKKPKPTKEEVEKTVNRLNEIKRDIEENGSSMAIKATLYSDDPSVTENQGLMSLSKKDGFAKEFKDAVFSTREGEISEPFETEFGWHIVKVEKIRGQVVDARHILIRPEISDEAREQAKTELDSIRSKVLAGEFTFQTAARNFSDEKETRFDGGVLRNPLDFSTRFELTKMDSRLYSQIGDLKGEEISQPLMEDTRSGIVYKLVKVIKRYPSHTADFSQDYLKIQDLALKDKQLETIREWMNDKIKDTYISVGSDFKECDFTNNWLKK
ncbi:periplasmic chaperone for outer membrane proteins SurA [Zhouia amylolytica]|uniref:Periplasmic chaperone for outer membrane proteins SurA n=1 Tax=Zhouia amylolytica TaxID=376730 RepID=A0A1I6RTI7_9FLAO|nr:peptidylprolyl isomerase [Zhouia amylolytica]SFS68039.1 periplasmic chaperone for outer membrane proteins SurA [Zhouia amylolytica]